MEENKLKKRLVDFDDKDLAIAAVFLLGLVYTIGSLLVGQDPSDVVVNIVTGVCGLAIGKKLA